jgi:hypothetical protein
LRCKKLLKYLTQTFMAHCNVMIYQQVTLSGDAEWPKVADAVIEALQHISVHMRSSGICGVYLLRAEESCSFGSKYSAYLVITGCEF